MSGTKSWRTGGQGGQERTQSGAQEWRLRKRHHKALPHYSDPTTVPAPPTCPPRPPVRGLPHTEKLLVPQTPGKNNDFFLIWSVFQVELCFLQNMVKSEPPAHERACIWKGLCRGNQLKMRLIRKAPIRYDCCPLRRCDFNTQSQREGLCDRDLDWVTRLKPKEPQDRHRSPTGRRMDQIPPRRP